MMQINILISFASTTQQGIKNKQFLQSQTCPSNVCFKNLKNKQSFTIFQKQLAINKCYSVIIILNAVYYKISITYRRNFIIQIINQKQQLLFFMSAGLYKAQFLYLFFVIQLRYIMVQYYKILKIIKMYSNKTYHNPTKQLSETIRINLSNKYVKELRQSLLSLFNIHNQAQSSTSNPSMPVLMTHSNSIQTPAKIQLIANDNKIVNLYGIEIVANKLMIARLHNNMLTALSGMQNLSFPSLQQLYLQFNQISTLDSIVNLYFPVLIRLSINNNQLDNINCQKLCTIYAPQLKILTLDNNRIANTQFVSHLPFPKLIDFNLNGNQILRIQSMKDWKFLAKLSKLQLANNGISRIGYIGTEMPNLRKLVLSNNLLTSAQFFITSSFPSLQILQIQNNLLTNLHFLRRTNLPKLIELKLNKNKITRMPIQQFRYGSFPHLQQIFMKNNEIVGQLQQLKIAFADVKDIRDQFYQQIFDKIGSNGQQRINQLFVLKNLDKATNTSGRTIIVNQQKLLSVQNMKIGQYNDNRKISILSCWRNRLITRNGPKIYTDMKKHFPVLSFLEF